MKKVTAWRPDTCGCEVLLEWDTDVSPAERVHVALPQATAADGSIRLPVKCAAHAAAADHAEHYAAVLAENQRKNRAIGAAAAASGLAPHQVGWQLDGARLPQIVLPAGADRETVAAAVRAVHPGAGVVG